MRKLVLSRETCLKPERFPTDKAFVNFWMRGLQKAKKPSAAFLLLSLLIHLLTAATLSFMDTPPPFPERVSVEYLEPPELTPIEDELTPEPARKKKEKRRDQVAEQQHRINEEIDDKAIFLSAFDQKVLKQTRAERSGKFNNTTDGGRKTEGQRDEERQKEQAQKNPRPENEELGELPELKELTPKFALDSGPKSEKLDENGNPSQTDDYLRDVQTGMQTLLSTREFVYYTYYNRIKEALRQHWEPNVREKVKIIYRQGRSIASAKDRVTQVLVTLDKNGDLLKVEVLTQSGVPDLDSAAMEAFRDAAPFPNPPKGMIESDGTIKIRWDFVLEA